MESNTDYMLITGHCLHSGIEPKIGGFLADRGTLGVNVFIFFLSQRHNFSSSIFIVTVLLFQLLHVKSIFLEEQLVVTGFPVIGHCWL
jgi:hypothetical protein